MSLAKNTEVLVVGAGPVGLTSALLLAKRGVEATVIDAKGGPAARSYACALHPRSLELFDRLGVLPELLPLGRRCETVAFYEGAARRAEVRLSQLPAKFPFLLVLPQNALEQALARAVSRRAGLRLHWHHQLAELRTDDQGVVATVEQLAGTSLGYIVPHWEIVVKDTAEIRAEFLVGADGHNSLVRQRLGLDYEQVGEAEVFSVFEFETDAALPAEVRVVLDAATTNVLWPLSESRGRWSFQTGPPAPGEEFPDKDRRAIWIEDPERNRQLQQRLRGFLRERAPWFAADVKGFDWASHVQFERRLVGRFGDGRWGLVGDAAHQTGPVGVQSLNVGLREADALADVLQHRLREAGATNGLESWQHRCREEWRRLLGLEGAMTASAHADPWVQRHAARILSCLPASGDDLTECAKQLRLDFPSPAAVARG
jgi:2-polyprenyl-6-methoxyphenol hydroxylase-like FAD-dependent oxidoreductase